MLRLQGFSYHEISDITYRSIRTVETHTRELKERLYIRSFTELRELATSQKWIEYKIKPYDEIEPVNIKT
jgi:DNA-binding NarL/FixJ family response regulator